MFISVSVVGIAGAAIAALGVVALILFVRSDWGEKDPVVW